MSPFVVVPIDWEEGRRTAFLSKVDEALEGLWLDPALVTVVRIDGVLYDAYPVREDG